MPLISWHLDQSILLSQGESLVIALVFIFLLLAIKLRSWRGGLMGLAPIVLAIALMFGLMGLTGIPDQRRHGPGWMHRAGDRDRLFHPFQRPLLDVLQRPVIRSAGHHEDHSNHGQSHHHQRARCHNGLRGSAVCRPGAPAAVRASHGNSDDRQRAGRAHASACPHPARSGGIHRRPQGQQLRQQGGTSS